MDDPCVEVYAYITELWDYYKDVVVLQYSLYVGVIRLTYLII